MKDLPSGTVTFLFTDIEGSTRLLQEFGETYGRVQDEHSAILRKAITEGEGREIRTEGDSFFVVFPTALGALRAAVAAQRELHSHDWLHGRRLRARMGLHTGEGRRGGDDYLGIDVNRAARIAAAEASREVAGALMPPAAHFMIGDPVAGARGAIGDAAVERALAEGRAMDYEAAVAYAHQES